MSNAQLGQFALATACLYLMGCWSLAQGMSLRLRGKGVSVSSGLLIASVTLAVLFYYSQFENDLLLRIQSLAFAMALMQALALPAFVQLKPAQDWVESLVRWTYGFSVGYALFRPLAVSLLPVNELQELTRSGYWAFSQVVALVFAMLFAVVEAGNQLGFSRFSDMIMTFVEFAGDVLLGSAILVIGFMLANIAYEAISRASGEGGRGTVVARVARFAILGIVLAMGLRAMGIADDIVNLAFGLTLGAVAVAFALAFGLGGRDAAGRLATRWVDRLTKSGDTPPPMPAFTPDPLADIPGDPLVDPQTPPVGPAAGPAAVPPVAPPAPTQGNELP